MTAYRRGDGGDRGSASVELVIIAPALLFLIVLLIAAGRIALSGGAIQGVAASAARQASLARTAADARRIATTTARRSLADQHLDCQHAAVTVDTSGFTAPLGRLAEVRVDVTCTVRLADLALPGLPGAKVLHDSFSSPLDPYRGHQ